MGDLTLFDQPPSADRPERRYWVHRLEATALQPVALRKSIGSRSKRARLVRELRPGDAVVLATGLLVPQERGLPPTRRIAFVAIGQVEEVEEHPHPIAGYDQHRTKLRLRGLRFFDKPFLLEDAGQLGLQLFAGKKKLSDAMDFEYRAVSEDDFRRLVHSQTLVEGVPQYLTHVEPRRKSPFTDQQLLEIFRLTRDMLRVAMPRRPQVEIKAFLRAAAGFIEGAGLGGHYDSLYQDYRRLACQTGFRHSPSREPDLQVELLEPNGSPRQLAYVSLR